MWFILSIRISVVKFSDSYNIMCNCNRVCIFWSRYICFGITLAGFIAKDLSKLLMSHELVNCIGIAVGVFYARLPMFRKLLFYGEFTEKYRIMIYVWHIVTVPYSIKCLINCASHHLARLYQKVNIKNKNAIPYHLE